LVITARLVPRRWLASHKLSSARAFVVFGGVRACRPDGNR